MGLNLHLHQRDIKFCVADVLSYCNGTFKPRDNCVGNEVTQKCNQNHSVKYSKLVTFCSTTKG